MYIYGPAPPRAAPTQTAHGMSGFWIRQIPGHALHENGLQRQKSVGTLVRNHVRRAAVVPRINRLSTGCQPRVNRTFCSPVGLHGISFVRASVESFRTVCHDRRKAKGTVVFWANRPIGVPSYRAPPRRSAVRRPAPTRPWYVRVLDSTNRFTLDFVCLCFRRIIQDSLSPMPWRADRPTGVPPCPAPPRPAPPPCVAPPGAAHGMPGLLESTSNKTVCPGDSRPPLPPKASRASQSEARTNEIPCKPMGEHNGD